MLILNKRNPIKNLIFFFVFFVIIISPIQTYNVSTDIPITFQSVIEDKNTLSNTIEITSLDLLIIYFTINSSEVDVKINRGEKELNKWDDVVGTFNVSVAFEENGTYEIEIINPGFRTGGDPINVTGTLLILEGLAGQASITIQNKASLGGLFSLFTNVNSPPFIEPLLIILYFLILLVAVYLIYPSIKEGGIKNILSTVLRSLIYLLIIYLVIAITLFYSWWLLFPT